MHLFYTPALAGEVHTLDEQESKHAVRVLRLVKGDPVILVDGSGGWFEAVIVEDHPKRCQLIIKSKTSDYQSLPYSLHLAVSPTKNLDRFEWFLEKATEIGITEITPLLCHRTERKQVKKERLERILVSAMKQSLKAYKPILNDPVPIKDFLEVKRGGTLGIAHCYPQDRKVLHKLEPTANYTLLVGPEGDFTEEEVADAMKAGYLPFHLGKSRLRTETAAVYITAAISFLDL